jgi:hypothetical protein
MFEELLRRATQPRPIKEPPMYIGLGAAIIIIIILLIILF